jgi:arsenate reductase
MSAAVTLYHNPRCSKSRAALAMLQLRGLKAHIVNYLDTPPSQSDIRQLLDQLNADSPPTNDALQRCPLRRAESGRGQR